MLGTSDNNYWKKKTMTNAEVELNLRGEKKFLQVTGASPHFGFFQ